MSRRWVWVLGLTFALVSLVPFWAVLIVEAGWAAETCEGFCPTAPAWIVRYPVAALAALGLAWTASGVGLVVMLARRRDAQR